VQPPLVRHGSHVVHSGLERGHLPHAVREAPAALVEHDHPDERRQVLDEADEQRLFPGGEEIAGEPRTKMRFTGAEPTF
jgi:hypothetical protein